MSGIGSLKLLSTGPLDLKGRARDPSELTKLGLQIPVDWRVASPILSGALIIFTFTSTCHRSLIMFDNGHD